MPEYAEFALIRFSSSCRASIALFTAEKLMVLGDQFNQPALGIHEQCEVLDDVQ